MEITAQLRFYRQSPRKVRLVANSIRGLAAQKALEQLSFTDKRSADPLYKLVKSALANASHNFSLDPENLFIKKIMIDTGPTLKRWRARAFGRSAPIRKRTSHITLILDEKEPTVQRTQKRSGEKAETIITVKTREEIKAPEVPELEGKKSALEHSDKKPSQAQKIKGFAPRLFRRKAG